MRPTRLLLLLALIALLAQLPGLAGAQPPQPPLGICFPDVPGIENCLDPAFAGFWQSNGGLPVFGYPISPVEQYQPPDGAAPLNVQWTERNRLELHPGNPPAYRVLLGRMGAERLAQLGRNPVAEYIEQTPQEGCLWFAETRINICDEEQGQGFKSYWERNGLRVPGLSPYQQSLALFGLPLTIAKEEPGPDGRPILTQWFERARFEWHPDKPEPYKVLLGLLGNELRAGFAPPPPPDPRGGRSIFGVEINRGFVGVTNNRLVESNSGWVRYNGILWNEIEPEPGQRRWESFPGVERELRLLANSGATTMLVVRGTPAWAQQVPGAVCGPIKAEALDEFAAFMGDMVARYSKAPYNIKYWELGNEPDVDPDLIGPTAPFGCWGDESDPYYGGAAYAAMLKAVYPVIKAADPEATVVLGGLLLDCDPATNSAGTPCVAGNFLEGVLRGGGGDFFDLMAYHSYVYWVPLKIDWDFAAAKWRHRGGALLGKLDFIKTTLAKYGYVKPIVMNEGSLLCWRSNPQCVPEGFREAQANYAARLYARSLAADLVTSIWFTLNGPGFQEGGMLDRNQQPLPAYNTYSYLNRLMGKASFTDRLSTGALEGYAFRTPETAYQIYWMNDETTAEVRLPPGTTAIYNVAGEPISFDPAVPLRIGFDPLIIVHSP